MSFEPIDDDGAAYALGDPADEDPPREHPTVFVAAPGQDPAFIADRFARGRPLRDSIDRMLTEHPGGKVLVFDVTASNEDGVDGFLGTAWRTDSGRFVVTMGATVKAANGKKPYFGFEIGGVIKLGKL